MEILIQELQLTDHLLAIMLGLPRLYMILQIAPFLGGAVVTGSIRTVIALAFYSVLHPAVMSTLPEANFNIFMGSAVTYGLIILKETLIGTILGLLVGMLFWAIQSAGILVDFQRGNSQSNTADMLTNDSSSPYGTFFFQCLVIVFFITGGFFIVLQAIYNSYIYWPVTSFLPIQTILSKEFVLFFAGQTANVILLMVLFSAPILVACLLTDLSLGLINRFASQLNVFIISMPIKSGIASFLTIFYLLILLKVIQPKFQEIVYTLQKLPSII